MMSVSGFEWFECPAPFGQISRHQPSSVYVTSFTSRRSAIDPPLHSITTSVLGHPYPVVDHPIDVSVVDPLTDMKTLCNMLLAGLLTMPLVAISGQVVDINTAGSEAEAAAFRYQVRCAPCLFHRPDSFGIPVSSGGMRWRPRVKPTALFSATAQSFLPKRPGF